MKWREIGPYRGGRSIAVAGHPNQPYTYYFGATGGGIWKTEDGGHTWLNVSDTHLKVGIVGALAVAESDPNVIFAGTGESCIRGNTMPGEGIYKSSDAGKTWYLSGLAEAQTVSRIRIHPKDDNLVYAAVFGHVFGTNPERGVFRSADGGKSWRKILYKDERTGAIDLALDPINPRIIYAALWEAYRNPWSMSSGGPGSGLWKSTDGGDTWKDITTAKGLPDGVKGRIGIAVSPVKAGRIWAMVEADEGGLFRSEDGGVTWTRVNEERRIRQRAWYYSHLYADTKNPDMIYVLNVGMYRSIDGGKTLQGLSSPHGDHHDLWIDPNDPSRMIVADDGGASVSYTAGRTWSEQDIPTAQFYHVTVDSQFPYRIYGAQQDNSTVGIASRTFGFGIDRTDWRDVGGGESGYIAVNPANPDIIYAGSYDGLLTRFDKSTEQYQDISVWPDNPMGAGAEGTKYRFQWTYPIHVSKYDQKTVYTAAQYLFKTTNEGMAWERISPDLTRNDTSKFRSSGGPITKDNTSVEYYGTIFAFAESPLDKALLWTGSDDGLVHVTTDGGATWNNVTPKGLPEWSMISILEASPFDPGTAYVAANRYKLNDRAPYLFVTTDFGRSWRKIVSGIPANEFVHVIRADPNKRGLLYAGTERGVYVSRTDGTRWEPLQLNLPVVPVHDLAVQAKEKDLVAATHGRSFWVLDDLNPLYQIDAVAEDAPVVLFAPRDVYRVSGYTFDDAAIPLGKNPPNGVVVYYYLRDSLKEKDTLRLEFLDARGTLIKTFTGQPSAKLEEAENSIRKNACPADKGMNRFEWDMRYPDAVELKGAILWGGTTRGPLAVPGVYTVRLRRGTDTIGRDFSIRKDPRIQTTAADFQEQFDFLIKVRDKISAAHEAVNIIRDIKRQTGDLTGRLEKHPAKKAVEDSAKSLNDKLAAIENEIVQTKIKAGQDALNYPIKLNNKIAVIADVVASADARPTAQAKEVYAELAGKLDIQLAACRRVLEADLPAFERSIKALEIPAVVLKPIEYIIAVEPERR